VFPAALGVLRDLRAGNIPAADPALPVVTVGADRDHELVRPYQARSDIALLLYVSVDARTIAGLGDLAVREFPGWPRTRGRPRHTGDDGARPPDFCSVECVAQGQGTWQHAVSLAPRDGGGVNDVA
jgi:hypothetical protein